MSTSTGKATTITLDAYASKGSWKGSEWAVTVPGTPVNGWGATLTDARSDASRQLASMAENVTELPVLVRDAGSLWIITAHPEGYRSMRLGPDDKVSGCVSVGGGTPAEHAASLVRHHEGAVRLV